MVERALAQLGPHQLRPRVPSASRHATNPALGHTASPGRPRDPALDVAILAAAERLLREQGYAGMSLDAVATEAGTTVPSLRRRFRDKADLVGAVIDSMRVAPLKENDGSPREQALAVLENFRRNLARPHSMALLGTLLAEEHRHPELIARFRDRLAKPRRALVRQALQSGIDAAQFTAGADLDATVSMLIGSFYGIYVSTGRIPKAWPERVLAQLWRAP